MLRLCCLLLCSAAPGPLPLRGVWCMLWGHWLPRLLLCSRPAGLLAIHDTGVGCMVRVAGGTPAAGLALALLLGAARPV